MTKSQSVLSEIANGKTVRESIASKCTVKEDRYLSVFSPGSSEFEKLSMAAQIISFYSGHQCRVQTTYFDYGQNWKYTTVIADVDQSMSYQLFTPRDQEDLLNCNDAKSLGEFCQKMINKI